ncbi:PREDICTED: phosphatidylinositol 4-phosphate 5-kinase 1-like [Papilio xuthus]|uniref:Phosphatidylinositol 4-phosphate 5-kinase 1-like n=1 Tax=Papilio xuthus TaxID=66420 RepID=A0A194PVC0_PAPXU|nr:PREDICTED: phosphatidylinositol 4-phosphate 5-kinase 1-like [Papilio xuthus]XP_013179830.1 PREDICTED: phosphatidylinositol 4-phosphate 5-kinase 1-like [Papilio xuthus]KPI96938.1 Phosphatidylinositol-4-phosphate 5-kinase 1 [Papilio xuthus]
MTESGENSETATVDTKKQAKEILVIQDEGFFVHDTGDTYNGSFEVKKKDRSIKMHGPGIYTTAEGDAYAGYWENDKLGVNDEVMISYQDGSRYQGLLKDWCYTGRGRYYYPDGTILQCEFVDNCPVGNLTLIDPNGHTWLGKAEHGYCWFQPVNHLYVMLETRKRRYETMKVLT